MSAAATGFITAYRCTFKCIEICQLPNLPA